MKSNKPEQRIEAVDNAKGILIFLVVLGHLLEPKVDEETTHRILYFFIYTFHMPAFVFLSGMLAKQEISLQSLRKWIATLIVPLLLFQVIYELPGYLINGTLSDYTLNLRPYWTLWFLISLFCWRIALPCILQLRFPIVLAILVSILAGYVSEIGYFLGVSRTIYFFPFFLIGHFYGKQIIQYAAMQKTHMLALCSLAIIFLYCVGNLERNTAWLWGSRSYSALGEFSSTAGLFRLELYLVSVISCVAFLMLVPNKKTFWTLWGQRSMQVFLWHTLVVQYLNQTTLTAFHSSLGSLSWLICILESCFIVSLLSTDFLALQTDRLIRFLGSLVLSRSSQVRPLPQAATHR